MANDLKRWDGDSGEQRRLGRPVSRICVQIVLLLLVFVLGVLLGSRYGGLLGLVPESANRGWSGQSPSVDADSEVGARAPEHLDETDPERLLQYIDQQLKGALARRKWLASAAKEGRIAYNLLRQRGYSDDSYACQRLIAGQKRFDVAIELAEQKIAEAQRCQRQLVDVLDARSVTEAEGGLPDELRIDIRRCLAKRGRTDRGEIEIPDERWSGGPDLRMKPNRQPAAETQGRASSSRARRRVSSSQTRTLP